MTQNPDHLTTSLPDQRNYDQSYGLAYKLAAEKLAGVADLQEVCRRTESICELSPAGKSISLKYLNKVFRVSWPDVSIESADSPGTVDLRDKILILHYLTHAKGTPLTGQFIAYKEMQEGASYFPTFFARAVGPLVKSFGQNPDSLLEVAGEMGGKRVNLGDTAVTFPAFARVPITLVIRSGDEEFPPDASILFDSTILDYLPVEDVIVLCQTIVWRLIKEVRK